MLTIWGRPNSHNVKKVQWLAEEMALPYVRHDVGGAFGMDDAYRAKNPNALVPTIDDGDLTLWESGAIMRYLAARYGAPRWWPEDPAVRASGEKWMDWQIGFSEIFRPAFWGYVRQQPETRDMAAITASTSKVNEAMAILNDELEKTSWLSGEDFGIYDMPMAAYTHTYFSLPIERPGLPALTGWYERLKERPAYQKIVMIPIS